MKFFDHGSWSIMAQKRFTQREIYKFYIILADHNSETLHTTRKCFKELVPTELVTLQNSVLEMKLGLKKGIMALKRSETVSTLMNAV